MAKQRGGKIYLAGKASQDASRGHSTLGNQFTSSEELTEADRERIQRANMHASTLRAYSNNRGTLRFHQIT